MTIIYYMKRDMGLNHYMGRAVKMRHDEIKLYNKYNKSQGESNFFLRDQGESNSDFLNSTFFKKYDRKPGVNAVNKFYNHVEELPKLQMIEKAIYKRYPKLKWPKKIKYVHHE